jgi:hypothetical protein
MTSNRFSFSSVDALEPRGIQFANEVIVTDRKNPVDDFLRTEPGVRIEMGAVASAVLGCLTRPSKIQQSKQDDSHRD